MMMSVEANQWRATIGCFRATMQISSPSSKIFRPISVLVQVFWLFCFCYGFIAISIFVLPLVLLVQFVVLHCVATQLGFFPLFARMHHSTELLKRIPLGVIILFRHRHFVVKQLHSQYAYFNIACITCFTLYIQ